MELKHGWTAAVPAVMVAAVAAALWQLGLAWTPARLVLAAGAEGLALFALFVLSRDRMIAGDAGIEHHTWLRSSKVAWSDVARFHCDGMRLVMLGADGRSLFEVSDGAYGDARELMRKAIDELRSRNVVERRRDALVMTAAQRHGLDWVHRFSPLLLVAAASVLVTLAPLSARSLLGFAVLAATGMAGMWLNRRVAVTIGPDGIVDQRWISRTEVRWGDIASYRFTIDETSWKILDLGTMDELWLIPVWLIVEVLNVVLVAFVIVGRGALRTLAYGFRSDRFYRGRLTLIGADGKHLYTLAARTGHADVEDAFDRILDELAERQVTFANAS